MCCEVDGAGRNFLGMSALWQERTFLVLQDINYSLFFARQVGQLLNYRNLKIRLFLNITEEWLNSFEWMHFIPISP